MTNLTDAQWCILDLLARCHECGMMAVNRMELLHSARLPVEARARLVMAALTMPKDLVAVVDKHDFVITEAGLALLQQVHPDGPTRTADMFIAIREKRRFPQ